MSQNPAPFPQNDEQPDALFKRITTERSQRLGIKLRPSEIQLRQSTRGDLILIVPRTTSLQDTWLDFLRYINVLEFKSEGDRLDLREFIKNVLRVYALYVQNNKRRFRQLLNVIVVARTPFRLLKLLKEEGYSFQQTKGRPWLWQGQFGFQTVAIVCCNLLPIEQKYYPWLLFAPHKGKTWYTFVKELIITGNDRELLYEAVIMGADEVDKIYQEVKQMLNLEQLDPAEAARIRSLELEFVRKRLEDFQGHPDLRGELVSNFSAEERLSGLKPEERLSGLKPEERLSGLTDVEQEQLFRKLQERFAQPE